MKGLACSVWESKRNRHGFIRGREAASVWCRPAARRRNASAEEWEKAREKRERQRRRQGGKREGIEKCVFVEMCMCVWHGCWMSGPCVAVFRPLLCPRATCVCLCVHLHVFAGDRPPATNWRRNSATPLVFLKLSTRHLCMQFSPVQWEEWHCGELIAYVWWSSWSLCREMPTHSAWTTSLHSSLRSPCSSARSMPNLDAVT